MKRLLVPIIGVALVSVTVIQMNSTKAAAIPTGTTAATQALRAQRIVAEGRFAAHPGAEVNIGSDVAGVVATVRVEEKQVVRRGEVIVTLESTDLDAAIAEAAARANEADADIRLFEVERDRMKLMFTERVGSRQAWDRAERDLDAARARRASAGAEVRRLEAVRDKYQIRSPIDGVVVERAVHPGEAVALGDTVITVADLSRTRVEAEVDEFDAGSVTLGAEVIVRAEGYPDVSWRGHVEEVPDVVISRRLKPQDPARPIDTRVLLVKIALDESTPLKLGQRVEVEVRTGART